MKTLSCLILLLLALPAAAESPDPLRMMATVRELSVAIGARPAASEANETAIRHIAHRFREIGYDVEIQRFRMPDGRVTANVIARSAGTAVGSGRAIVIGAHHDTVRNTPGADDNASGIAVLLELARLAREGRWRHEILWVAFGAEEIQRRRKTEHHLGSRHLARVLAEEGRLPDAMISIDGVGVEPSLRVLSMELSPPLTRRRLTRAAHAISPTAFYQKDPGADGWSDHEPFERYGVSSAWLVRRKNLRLHSPRDTYATVRPEYLVEAAKVIVTFLDLFEAEPR